MKSACKRTYVGRSNGKRHSFEVFRSFFEAREQIDRPLTIAATVLFPPVHRYCFLPSDQGLDQHWGDSFASALTGRGNKIEPKQQQNKMDLTGQQQSFSFPLLKNADIINCMSELGVPLTADELSEPARHKDRVREVFVMLIEFGLGVTEAELRTPSAAVQAKRAALPHPELHEESLSEIKFLKKCMKFMKVCGLHDFGWKDLNAPTSKRFRRQLSGAINFARFREELLPIYDELTQQRQEILAALQEAQGEHTNLLKDMDDAKAVTDECWKEIEEVENDCAEIETEIAQQNKLQASIRQESTNLKKKANELKDAIATVAIELEEAQVEERKLSSQVVKSPARVKSEMNVMMAGLENEKRESANAEKEANLVKRKIANVTKARGIVFEAAGIMMDTDAEKTKYEGVANEIKDKASVIASTKKQTAELAEHMEDYEKQVHRIEEKIEHTRKQGRTKLDFAQEALDNAQRELLSVEKGRRDGIARVEASEAEVRALEDEIETDWKDAQGEIAEMIEEFRSFEAVTLEHDNSLMEGIGAC